MDKKKGRSLPLVTIDRNNMKDPPKMQRGLALRRQRCKELQGLVVVLERREEEHHGVLLSEIVKAGLLEYAQRLAPISVGDELPFQDRWLKKSDPSARKLLTDLKRWASEPDPPEDKSADSPLTVPDASTQDSNTSQEDTTHAPSDQKKKDPNAPDSSSQTPDASSDSKEPAVVVDGLQELVVNEALNQTKIDFVQHSLGSTAGTNDADILNANVQPITQASISEPDPGDPFDFRGRGRSNAHGPLNPKGKQPHHAAQVNNLGHNSVIRDAPPAPDAVLITNQVKKHSDVAEDSSSRPEIRMQQPIFPQIRTRNRYSSFPSTVAPPALEDHMPVNASPDTVIHPSISQAKQQALGSPSNMANTGNQRPIFPPVDMEAERKRLRPVVPPVDMESQRKRLDSWLRWWLERHEKKKGDWHL